MVRMSTINGCLEREGLARLTISILVITTAGCLAYTWGYAEVSGFQPSLAAVFLGTLFADWSPWWWHKRTPQR